jgi:hypothetical protein
MRASALFAFLVVVALGLLLRFWNLPAQILGDDEMHTVRAAVSEPVSRILVTYQLTDNCIPLTALFRSLLDLGVRPTEMTLRLPVVLSGVLLLLVAPWWVARRIGRGPALAFAALLAISPGLVFYSRIARSYAPVVLFGFGAVAAFEAWWRRPSWKTGVLYVALAALAGWFHLGAAPFVVAPFLFALGDLLFGRDWTRLRPLLLLGLATVAAFLVFLAPALDSLLFVIANKQGELALGGAAVLDVLRLQAGSALPAVAVLFWLVTVAGFVRLLRLDRRLALYTATVVLGHLAGLLILAPESHEIAHIFHRYTLIASPWVLLWTAIALGQPWEASKSTSTVWRRAQPSIATGAVAFLLAAGPLPDLELRRSSFAHHNDYLAFQASRPDPSPKRMPRFYQHLLHSSPRGAVLEYPWVPVWRLNRSFYLYQEHHGREVVVASPRQVLGDPRLGFRNQVRGNADGFLSSRARWLVVHRDLADEEARWPEPAAYPQPKVLPRFRGILEQAGPAMIRRLRRAWGKPDYADRRVAVWDLERVRREGERDSGVGQRAAVSRRPR